MSQDKWNDESKLELNLLRHKEPEPELGIDEAFFQKMHDNIMAEIETKPIPKKKIKVMPLGFSRWWLENRGRLGKSGSVGMMLSLFILQLMAPIPESLATQELLQRTERQPQLLAQTTLVASHSDFLVDVAHESLNHLSDEQLKALIDDL